MSPAAPRILWWLLPTLMAAALLSTRFGPELGDFLLTRVERSNCNGNSPWKALSLPKFSYGQGCERVLLRSQLGAGQTLEQALLVSSVGNDARIWVNGHLLRDFDPRTGFDSTSQPLLLELQPGILRAGANEILLQLRSGLGRYSRSALGRIYLGPSEPLRARYMRNLRVGIQGAQFAVVVGLAILLTLLPIAWSRQRDSSYRWFMLAALSSGLYLWNMGWPLRLSPSMLWHFTAHAGLAVALWAMLRYSAAVTRPSPACARWIDGLSAVAIVALLLMVTVDERWVGVVGDSVYRLGLLTQLLFLAAIWWRQGVLQHPLGRWLSAAAVLNLVLGIADSMRIWQGAGSNGAPYLVHWGILYLLLLMLVGQVKGILAALAAAEQSQQLLGRALDQRTLELQQEFALRQQAEQARTLAEERQRIMRDMHDGVGGQLVALIGQAEHGNLDGPNLKQQLRRSLDDLRLMIDSLDDACADLGVALGMLRQRLQSGLKNLPIQVSWHTAQLPDMAPRTPDEVLQVLRIVQEAITNALKHAQCRQLLIKASWVAGWLEISVQDDGVGMAGGSSGRGLPSMRLRAAGIGASIEIAEHAPGTRVLLRLPQALAGA